MRLNVIVLLKLGLLKAKSREHSRCHGVYFKAGPSSWWPPGNFRIRIPSQNLVISW